MKTLLHIVGKDARRIWPWLAVQFFVTLAHYAFFVWVQTQATGERFAATGVSSFGAVDTWVSHALFGLEWFAWVMAAAALVHEDVVPGDRAFWKTRPIGRGRLFAAKAIGLLCFALLLPLIPKLFWWAFNDFGWGDFRTALLGHLSVRVVLLLLIWALAAGTASAGSFIMGCIIAAMAAFGLLFLALNAGTPVGHEESERLADTRLLLCVWLSVAGSGAAVIARYASPRGTPLFVAVIATIVATVSVARFWPIALHLTPDYLYADPALSGLLNVRISPTSVNEDAVSLNVAIEGVPQNHEVRGMVSDFRWLYRTGEEASVVEAAALFYTTEYNRERKNRGSREHYLSGMSVGHPDDGTVTFNPLHVGLPETIPAEILASDRVQLQLNFRLRVIREDTVFESPLPRVATVQQGPATTTVAHYAEAGAPRAIEVLFRSPFRREAEVRFRGEGWRERDSYVTGGDNLIRRLDHTGLYVDFVQLVARRYELSPKADAIPRPRVVVFQQPEVCAFWPRVTLRGPFSAASTPVAEDQP